MVIAAKGICPAPHPRPIRPPKMFAARSRASAAGAGTTEKVFWNSSRTSVSMYHLITSDNVWEHYGLTTKDAAQAGMNPQMFNSSLDGSKSAIEMVAIGNACGLDVPTKGLAFPPCGVDDWHMCCVRRSMEDFWKRGVWSRRSPPSNATDVRPFETFDGVSTLFPKHRTITLPPVFGNMGCPHCRGKACSEGYHDAASKGSSLSPFSS